MTSLSTSFIRRKNRARYKAKKLANGKPRLVVTRSNKNIHAQLIDDQNGQVIACASTLDKEFPAKLKAKSNRDAAKAVGELVGKRAKSKKVSEIVFDRGGYIYHGRVQSLAEGARAAGLKF